MITILGAPLGAASSSGHHGWDSRYVLPIDPLKRFSLCDMLPSLLEAAHIASAAHRRRPLKFTRRALACPRLTHFQSCNSSIAVAMLLIRTAAKFLSGLLDPMRLESFGLDVRRFDQGRPLLDLALDKFLEIFGRPALGRHQYGSELLHPLLGCRIADCSNSG